MVGGGASKGCSLKDEWALTVHRLEGRELGPESQPRQGPVMQFRRGDSFLRMFLSSPKLVVTSWLPEICSAQHLKSVFLIDRHNWPNTPDRLTFWNEYCAHRSPSGFLSEPPGEDWMGLSITFAHGAAVGLPKGHICLKIKLYLPRLLPFPIHRSCRLKPCLGEHVACSKLINRLSVSLCPFWIVHIEKVF